MSERPGRPENPAGKRMPDARKPHRQMSLVGVRRGKAAFFSGCKSHPATIAPAGSNRSSHGGNEVAEASGVEGHIW